MDKSQIHEEILCAGFGGQGIMLLGKLLTFSGMREGRHVTYIPSYGAEVRGGTAYCNVIISSEEIASPIVSSATTAIVMNEPSFVKYQSSVRPGGLLLLNSTLVLSRPERNDIEVISIPATAIADGLGSIQCANMVMLGCLLARNRLIRTDSVIEGLRKSLPRRKSDLLEINIKGLDEGRIFYESLLQKGNAARK
jgi:2-oxoglutarate ferredoxin oxidoreductase subunit gamma